LRQIADLKELPMVTKNDFSLLAVWHTSLTFFRDCRILSNTIPMGALSVILW